MSADEGQAAGRPRKAVGPDRQTYLNETDIDRLMAIVLALVSEVASIRERLDTHERIAAEGEAPSVDRVEAYRPDPGTEEAREAWRDAYIRRLFRVITEDVEALRRLP
jgi:glucuronate isomerase